LPSHNTFLYAPLIDTPGWIPSSALWAVQVSLPLVGPGRAMLQIRRESPLA